MNKKYTLLVLLLVAVGLYAEDTLKTRKATELKSVRNFISEMVKKHHYDSAELTALFDQIQLPIYQPPVNKAPTAKKEPKKPMTWDKYRSLFITQKRIEKGVEFYNKYQKILYDAKEKYGVPPEIIVAILGIETNYGAKKGDHPVLYTLTNKAFNRAKRSKFYKKELEHFLILAQENDIDPLVVTGSYAGAMGYPQFISSSIRHFAIDFDGDYTIDLFSNPTDAIGSIANYLAEHKWQDNELFAHQLEYDPAYRKLAASKTKRPQYTAPKWRNKGVDIGFSVPQSHKAALIRLYQESEDEYWLTFWNFYAITRYNHDNRYAMAAYQLSQAIKQHL